MKFIITFLIFGSLLISCAEKKKSSAKNQAPQPQENTRTLANKTKLSQQFSDATGLRGGIFKSNDPEPSQCLEGGLELLDVRDTVSIMVGGRLLVSDIKKGQYDFSFTERDCNYRFSVKWEGAKVISNEFRTCGKDVVEVRKVINISADEITYSIKSKINDASQSKTKCELERQS